MVASPSSHPFIDWDFPWNKPSTHWGTLIYGNPQMGGWQLLGSSEGSKFKQLWGPMDEKVYGWSSLGETNNCGWSNNYGWKRRAKKNKQLPSKPKACLQVNFNGRLEEFKGPRVLRHDAKEHRSHFEDANPISLPTPISADFPSLIGDWLQTIWHPKMDALKQNNHIFLCPWVPLDTQLTIPWKHYPAPQ